MEYFQMGRRVVADGTLIYQRSHLLAELKSGRPLPDDFADPFYAEIDPELLDGKLPTFFESPAFIATKRFLADLQEIGIDNLEVHPVVINDERGRVIEDYVLINVLGRVSCADMDKSDHKSLGEGMTIIDKLVIDPKKVWELDFFLVHEDTDCMVISDRVYKHLSTKGYDDIYFEKLETV